jgi:methylmalonyl-CoA mutase N-terminal domain/subunit
VAGSYAIEALTNAIERDVEDILVRIEAAGGTLAAIESGLIQREVQESAYRAQVAIDSGESVVVGVNRFADDVPPASIDTLQIDPDVERRQIERVRAVRAGRSATDVGSALAAVTAAARGADNLVPPIVTAVEARATVGEIADAMRSVFGEHEKSADL